MRAAKTFHFDEFEDFLSTFSLSLRKKDEECAEKKTAFLFTGNWDSGKRGKIRKGGIKRGGGDASSFSSPFHLRRFS